MAVNYFRIMMLVALAECAATGPALAQSAQHGPHPVLAKPYETESTTRRVSNEAWPEGVTPKAPDGFVVTRFAGDLDNPRSLYVLPNGDVLTAEAKTGMFSKNRIMLLRDGDGDGVAETRSVLIDGLNKPFGITLVGDSLYVANTDGVFQYPYRTGVTRIEDQGRKIIDLPAGGYNNHWTRNLLADPKGGKIYISVGSGSNVGENGMENEVQRANILEMDPDGSNLRIYADGLRNPVGMDWNPVTGGLWTAVNERDELGDMLVPDYITDVRKGGFYGWPYSYYGQNADPRLEGQRKDLVARAIQPDYAVGSHTASLGLAFYDKQGFPRHYRNGVFVAQHGSWNSSQYQGYKVIFIPFANGKPAGEAEDFLTGFLPDPDKDVAYGRPVSLAVTEDGALLVSDDTGNMIWRVAYEKVD